MATKKKKKRQKRKMTSARRRAESQDSGFQKTTVRTPEGMGFLSFQTAGIKRLDFLPYMVKIGNDFADAGDWHYEKTFHIHRIGANGEAHVCPKRTVGKRCPICEEYDRMRMKSTLSVDEEELMKSLRPKERQLFYVIDHDEREKGVQVWDMSTYLFGKKLDARIRNSDEDENFDTFFDPDDGMILKIGLEEKKFQSFSYYEVETIDFKKRKEPIDPELYEDLPSLDDLVKVEKYDKLKSIFHQIEDDEDEDEDDESLDSELAEVIENDMSNEDEDVEDEDDDDEDW